MRLAFRKSNFTGRLVPAFCEPLCVDTAVFICHCITQQTSNILRRKTDFNISLKKMAYVCDHIAGVIIGLKTCPRVCEF